VSELCPECGFGWDLDPVQLGQAIVALGRQYQDRLGSTEAGHLHRRVRPRTWSPLEYSCHIRDVLFNQRDRVLLALVEDVPTFQPMHRDERVELAGYAAEDVGDVAAGIAIGAKLLAHVLGRLRPSQWDRAGIYGYPAPAERDVRWIGRNVVHELQHHLWDIDQLLAGATG